MSTAQATAATAQEIKKAPRAATLVGPGPDNEVFRQGDPARIGGYVVEPLSWAERDPAPHLPTEPLSAEPVPPAVRPTPKPLLKVLVHFSDGQKMLGEPIARIEPGATGRSLVEGKTRAEDHAKLGFTLSLAEAYW